MTNVFYTNDEARQAARAAVNSQLAYEAASVSENILHENASVEAIVTLSPKVEMGEIETICLNKAVVKPCCEPPSDTITCKFRVSQKICLQIPLKLSAEVAAVPSGIFLGAPGVGQRNQTASCTYTIGYYRNHPEVTNALIALAGGSIILGSNSTGASFTVTAANASDVLSLNSPAPPIPLSPPLSNQYQVLYAQLLAAKLNVLRGAVCDAATAAIAAADAFIASSVSGVGKEGASIVQEPLAAYNEGTAEGCPYHCASLY